MAVTRAQKQEVLTELIDLFKKSKSIVFTQYQGTSVKDMRAVRKELRGKNVSFKVARKTLMSLAAKEAGCGEIPSSLLDGPIGLAFGLGDEISPAKVLHEFGKTHESVKIAGALFEGKFLSGAEAKVIAMLPGREQLLAQFVGSLKAPISKFHAVLHGLMRNFVFALSEVQKKRGTA